MVLFSVIHSEVRAQVTGARVIKTKDLQTLEYILLPRRESS